MITCVYLKLAGGSEFTVSPAAKPSYQVTNWRNIGQPRGAITIWFDEEVIDNWEHGNAVVRAVQPLDYSDFAIETLPTLRETFRPPCPNFSGVNYSARPIKSEKRKKKRPLKG